MTDQITKTRYLIDSGADVSVVPKNAANDIINTNMQLLAANGTPIKVFGETVKTIDLGFGNPYKWTFLVADVSSPIIGADFIRENDLLIDLKRNSIIDRLTNQSTQGMTDSTQHPGINMLAIEILKKFPNITTLAPPGTSTCTQAVHFIETIGPPVTARARPLNPEKYNAAKLEFEALIQAGICFPSKSNWSSPLHLVKKKDDTYRPCGDYRGLNAITTPDNYPLPYLTDFTINLRGCVVFTKIDLKKAYNQIPVYGPHIPKTAITTPFGLFEFSKMTFGLRNAAQTFQRVIHEVLRGLDFLYSYLDDIFVASKTEAEHIQHIEKVFDRLTRHNLSINLAKCEFGKNQIKFLGHIVNATGIRPAQEKVTAITDFPKPKTVVCYNILKIIQLAVQAVL